jgi:hypothetical protein
MKDFHVDVPFCIAHLIRDIKFLTTLPDAPTRAYGTVGTPAVFMDPPEGTTDTLYNFQMSGLDGQRAISDAAPGDPDFNGGRWAVVPVTFTELGMAVHDPDGDGEVNFELTSADQVHEHVGLGHVVLEPTTIYFECPLLPGHNR